MEKSAEDIGRILDLLATQLGRCWHGLTVAKILRRAFDSNKIIAARSFFSASYGFCLEASILAFSRVVLRDSDSVTIWYLINCVENSPRSLPNLPEDVVLESVQDFRQRLAEMQPFIDVVKRQRDHFIAHLDRKIINAPDVIERHVPISIDELDNAFAVLYAMLKVYYRALIPSIDFHLEDIEPTVQDDLAYLVGLMDMAQKGKDNV